MHELSIAQNIIDILQEEQTRQRFTRVVAVHLRVGALSNIVPEALQFCFEAIRDETLARGADMVIERVPGLAACHDCSSQVQLDDAVLICTECGSQRLTVLSGEELDIASIEVEGDAGPVAASGG